MYGFKSPSPSGRAEIAACPRCGGEAVRFWLEDVDSPKLPIRDEFYRPLTVVSRTLIRKLRQEKVMRWDARLLARCRSQRFVTFSLLSAEPCREGLRNSDASGEPSKPESNCLTLSRTGLDQYALVGRGADC